MKWLWLVPLLFAALGVLFFYKNFTTDLTPVSNQTQAAVVQSPQPIQLGSGIQGVVKLPCNTKEDFQCQLHAFEIGVYQDSTMVQLIKTDEDGTFQEPLAPGNYELRMENASTTSCISVAVVVPKNAYITTNLICSISRIKSNIMLE